MLRPWLEETYGVWWSFFAEDFDQAIYEWGTFIENRIEEKVNEYLDGIRSRNARATKRASKSGTSSTLERPSRERLREIRDEIVMYHVHDTVREYTTVRTGRGRHITGSVRVYLEKAATGDPAIDFDMKVGDVRMVRLQGESA